MKHEILVGERHTWTLSNAVVATILLVLLGACGGGTTTGSGNVRTETRPVQGFDSVEFAGAGKLTIEQTGTDSLEIRADETLLPSLTSEVAGTTLRLGVAPGTSIAGAQNITYRVTVARLSGLVVSGAGDVSVTGVDVPELSVAHSGAAQVTVAGRAATQVVDLIGIGTYDGRGLASQDADVSVSGTGTAQVDVSRTLRVRITGIGSVEYLGEPQLTQEITGIGQVKKL